ncbi:MAG: hypothetical protein FJ288_11730 [Planctomycetes bacterium]|nr:hypothetical protein [Planctomycetota bacterium]
MASPVLRAGAATSNITPWLGDPIVGGWNAPPARHIHDELHARCLVLDDGTTRLAFVVADSVGIPREVFQEAKRQIQEHTGLAPDRMLMAADHTHSATACRAKSASEPDQELPDYARFVARRISDGVRRAINQLEPARLAWGTASVPDQVFNRRWLMKPGTPLPDPFGGTDQVKMNPGHQNPGLLAPSGPVDPEVCFLSVQAADGRPIALLANYSLHYVGGTGPQEISADYFAAFADRIQQLIGADRLDPPLVGIMSNGTSGNVNNVNYAAPPDRRKPYEKIRLVADRVAQAVFAEYGKLSYRDRISLAMRQRELELAVRKPTPEQLAQAREMLAHPERPDKLPHQRTYARRIVDLHEAPATIPVTLQAVRIGEVGIAAIPFETFVETGLALKAASPLKPTFTISLANGSHGYLPTPEQHRLGGYETWLGTSKVEPDASTKISAALLEMFAEMKP